MTQVTVGPILSSAWTESRREKGEDRTLRRRNRLRPAPVSGQGYPPDRRWYCRRVRSPKKTCLKSYYKRLSRTSPQCPVVMGPDGNRQRYDRR